MKQLATICIIDDDEIYTTTIKKMIERHHPSRKVLVFPNGRLAIDYLTHHLGEAALLPELILLDLDMPILDGWSFLLEYEALKKDIPKKIRLYIVSATAREEDHEKINQLGDIAAFKKKPFSSAQLNALIDEAS